MPTLKVSDLKEYLSTKRDNENISLESIEYMMNKSVHNKAIVEIIRSCVDNYTPYHLKQNLVNQLRPEGIIQELIPTIKLGRRAGHTTAAVNYAKQLKGRHIYLISRTDEQVQEMLNVSGVTCAFKNQFQNRVSDNVHLMNLSMASKVLSRVAGANSVIIFDSSFTYNDPRLLPIISGLYLNHTVIFLGN